MAEQEQIKKFERTSEKKVAENVGEIAVKPEENTSKKGEELKAELDELLDEIDEVLEENAEEFVKSYIQKGGE